MKTLQIPPELTAQKRWVCYNGSKLPIDPGTGGAASSTDSGTWGTYSQAAEAVTRLGCRGVGFVLGDRWAGIDIDHCIDPATGEISADALAILDTMQSYTERSPSGTGIHILWRGKKPGKACRKTIAPGVGLEMYDGGRYFTVTGNSWHDPPLPVQERSTQAAAVYAKYLEKPKPAALQKRSASLQERSAVMPDDDALLELARQAKNGDKFAALWAGNYGAYAASHSEADLALCNLLAFWFGCSKARMDAAFRRSGLYRPKWDQRRGGDTYGSQTLDKAIADCQEIYDPTCVEPTEHFADEAEFLAMMGVKSVPEASVHKSPLEGAQDSSSPPAAPAPGKTAYSLDDTGNARRFRDLYGSRVRYNYTRGAWFLWDGKLWREDETAGIKQLCDEMLDGMEKQLFGMHDPDRAAALRKFIQKSRGSNAKKNLLIEAQHLAGIPVTDNDFDKDRGLLDLPNGVLRLSDGKLLPHDRALLMTRIAGAAYNAAAAAPTWLKFLETVTGGDRDLQTYLQVMAGYMLSGSVKEQCLFFLWGDGANGKTTFLNVLAELLGSYAMHTQSETIASQRPREGPRTDIARLKGARLVVISECPSDVYLDESTVKQLTGGDVVTARYLYGREFEYRPEFKIIMATNHKPRIRSTDAGIWRRVRLVPFTQTIPPDKQDHELPDKLRKELPGILCWALEGLRLWLKQSKGGKRSGLPACTAVDGATTEYRSEQDRIAAFLYDCTEPAPGCTIQAAMLYKAYRCWCEENGERYPLTNSKFGREIAKKVERQRGAAGKCYLDVRFTSEGNHLLTQAMAGTGRRFVSGGSPSEQMRMDPPRS